MLSLREIWLKLLKKPSALFGVTLIVFSAFLALFAFLIIPDKSENANEQLSQLALKPPGFKTKVLKMPLINKRKKSMLQSFLTGKIPQTQNLPFTDIKIDSTTIYLTGHNGVQKIYEAKHFLLAHLSGESLQKELESKWIDKKRFWFGSDKYGRDILSRIILGLRISLMVGLLAVLLSTTIGVVIGLVSGYFSGWIDDLFMWLINTVWSIPTVLLVFAIVMAFGRSVYIIFIAVGLTLWVDVARLIRGQVKEIKSKEFLSAANTMGFGIFRILFIHILPNLTGPLMVIAASNFAIAILIEAGLSYLGFGVQPPTPSLGNMLYENYAFAISGKVFAALIPAIVIMFLVLSFNLTGNGLRDILDVKETE